MNDTFKIIIYEYLKSSPTSFVEGWGSEEIKKKLRHIRRSILEGLVLVTTNYKLLRF